MTKVYLGKLLDELDKRAIAKDIKQSQHLLDDDHINILVKDSTAYISTAGYTKDEIIEILSTIIEGIHE